MPNWHWFLPSFVVRTDLTKVKTPHMTRASRTISRMILGASSALHASLGSAMWKLLLQPAGLHKESQGQVVSKAGKKF